MDRPASFSLLILTISRPGGYIALDPIYGLTATHPDRETARDLVAGQLTERIIRHPHEVRMLQLAAEGWPLKPEISGSIVTVETPA